MSTVSEKPLPFIALFIIIVGSIPVGWYWYAPGETKMVVERAVVMPLSQQIAAVAAGYVVKPIYMTLSVLIAVLLRRLKANDLVALRWGMISFFVGETFCAINYIFFDEAAHWAEYLHSYGMVVAFALMVYALMEGVDGRVIKLSQPDKRCAILELCGNCIKYNKVRCGATRLFLWFIPVITALAFIPLAAAPIAKSTHSTIVGTPYTYRHPVIYQRFEIRYLPVLAIILLALAWLGIWQQRKSLFPHIAKLFIAAGLGALGFSFFRMALIGVYQDDLMWATFWEEVTELMLVTAVLITLWQFRQTLYREQFPKSHQITWWNMLGFHT